MATKGTAPELERIKAIVAKTPTGYEMMGLFGKCEKEVIVWQTIHACPKNEKQHGLLFSFKGDGLKIEAPERLVENASSYAELVRDGYLEEREYNLLELGTRTVIVPTEKLLSHLEAKLK